MTEQQPECQVVEKEDGGMTVIGTAQGASTPEAPPAPTPAPPPEPEQ